MKEWSGSCEGEKSLQEKQESVESTLLVKAKNRVVGQRVFMHFLRCYLPTSDKRRRKAGKFCQTAPAKRLALAKIAPANFAPIGNKNKNKNKKRRRICSEIATCDVNPPLALEVLMFHRLPQCIRSFFFSWRMIFENKKRS